MSFYNRPEWLRIRYEILRKYGHRCMVCNRGREDGAVIHVDHIMPKSIFPEKALEFGNLQVLCRECNLGKSNQYFDDFRPMAHVSSTVMRSKRYSFGSKPWREYPKDYRRWKALSRAMKRVKSKLAIAEANGDAIAAAALMKQYLDGQRVMKTAGAQFMEESA